MRPTAASMRRPALAPRRLLLLLRLLGLLGLLGLLATAGGVQGMPHETIAHLRQETRDLFYHGFDGYMQHAFPEDELRPLSCAPLTRDRLNPAHVEVNDVLGNYSLTLVDSLSTLAIFASTPAPPRPARAARARNSALA
ncbi:ER glycosyl hydrolase, partial [Stagonosporopsis vannaccii]